MRQRAAGGRGGIRAGRALRPAAWLLALLLLSGTACLWHRGRRPPRRIYTDAQCAAWEERYDKRGRRHAAAVESFTTPAFLEPPAALAAGHFTVAATPPVLDFAVVQGLDPEYLGVDRKSYGFWGDYGSVTRDAAGRFYFGPGNHLAYGARAFIVRYDPAARRQEVVLDTDQVFDWGLDEFGDGKLHGDLDIAPNGDGWLLTFFGPGPSREEWDTTYRGGRLARFNVDSGESEDLGAPLAGASWPYHAWDWERQVLFGAGQRGQVLVYDTARRRTIRAGRPPAGIRWYNRAVLLDRDTGLFYSTDSRPASFRRDCRGEHRFVRYDPAADKFRLLEARVPGRPDGEEAPGPLRAYTREKDPAGNFWCADFYGALFRFHPGRDETEYAGPDWGDGEYIANLCLSPGGRYLYYLPGAKRFPDGMPVVQFDTRERRRKVLAFIQAPVLERYGFLARNGWGLALTADGAGLFFVSQGYFTPGPDERPRALRLALFLLHIPESERREQRR